jgi:6-phospho-beta-glucosidase
VPSELLRGFGFPLLLSNYCSYYYLADAMLAQQSARAGRVRADDVAAIEAEAFAQMRTGHNAELPAVLSKRGSVLEQMGLYGPAAYFTGVVSFMQDVWTGRTQRLAPIVPQRGAVPGLDAEACLQLSCLVDRAGPHALAVPQVPEEIRGLLYGIKAFESLTVRAAMEGSRQCALKALLSNPLIGSYAQAQRAVHAILTRQTQYLAQWR